MSDDNDGVGSESKWWDQVRDKEQVSPAASDNVRDGVVDFSSTFRIAVQAQCNLPERNPLKLPWEEGVFGEIFGESVIDVLPDLKRSMPTLLPTDEKSQSNAPAAAKRSRILDKGVSVASAVKIRVPVAWSEQREAQFEIGIDLWLTLMKDWGSCKFIELLDAEPPGDPQRAVVNDVFRDSGVKELYAYLKQLEKENAPKSRCTGLLEAIVFVRYVVGVDEVDALITSRRCKGVGMVETFKESRQAPALTVSQLMRLHETLRSHSDPWTRHFAGCALIATYSRCRWSDIQHSEELIIDRDSGGVLIYLELRIGVHKTCRLQSKRHRFLHVVSPSMGLQDFGELWLASRRAIGLEDERSMPFCPAPDASGSPTVRGIDSDEATTWLRLIFRPEPVQAVEPSSKSFKATVLSWAAKRGVDGLSLQKLGYHAAGGLDVVYSRDAQAPDTLIVEKLLAEVREGRFKPDEWRGGRLIGSPVPLLEPLAKPVVGRGIPDELPASPSLEPRPVVKEEMRSDAGFGSAVSVHGSDSEIEEELECLGSSTDSAEEEDFQACGCCGPWRGCACGF
ncbi:unnamed protein product [Symbiodinium sp. CCMP2456]|nr:unnamed protein product [Symbiodinium sp. CCMP2456]